MGDTGLNLPSEPAARLDFSVDPNTAKLFYFKRRSSVPRTYKALHSSHNSPSLARGGENSLERESQAIHGASPRLMNSEVWAPWFLLLLDFFHLSLDTWPSALLPSCVSSGDVGQVLSTEEQVAAQFANGGAASRFRGQWLCYEAAFDSKEGIVFLEEALGKAVDQGAL